MNKAAAGKAPGYGAAEMAAGYAAAEELAEASNAAVDMVHAGRLDEAERAAHELLERFPEVHDGYDRLLRAEDDVFRRSAEA